MDIKAPTILLFSNGDGSSNFKTPPCSSTIFLTIANPRPVPFSRVVTYGSNNLDLSCGKPIPLSEISISTFSLSFI